MRYSGSQDITPLLCCCHPAHCQSDSTEEQNQLGGVTEEGLDDVALMLLEKGADIYAGNEIGLTPIFMASLNLKLRVVKAMIDRWGSDFDPHRTIPDGMTPIAITQRMLLDPVNPGPVQEMLSLLEKAAESRSKSAESVSGSGKCCSACHAPSAEKKCPCGIRYCSAKCQKEHWLQHRKEHKSLMKQMTAVKEGAVTSAEETAGGKKKKKKKKKKKTN
jgi:hypothetical protein